jgi:iron(III) transport system ATP-binding protein
MNALPNSSPILQIDQVSRQFGGTAHPAVASIQLSLQSGEILALLGPSGCGKTTLLRLIAGFEVPETGTIQIAEQVVAGAGAWVPPEKRGVGMVFQDYALFPHLTIQQNVAFGLTQARKPIAAVHQRVKEAIALVGLEGLEKRYPHQISGGQQQRVALARALAPYPFLILLDEPLSNLDVQVRLRLRQELRSILKAAGTSAIFVTHDQEEALSIADQVGVMRQGRLEQIGSPEGIYQAPASQFVAEFVAQANLLPAQRDGEFWQTPIGKFPQRQVMPANVAPANAQDVRPNADALASAVLMIRQEDLALQPDEAGAGLIRDRQFLGRENRYLIQLAGGQELVARTGADLCLPIGTTVQIAVTARSLRLFVPEA